MSHSKQQLGIGIQMALLFAFAGVFLFFSSSAYSQVQQGLNIYGVNLSKPSFNPTAEEKVQLAFSLSSAAEVKVEVFGPRFERVAIPAAALALEAGAHSVEWDGRDENGDIIPDEAYFFTITAQAGSENTVYDPTTFSGGEPYDIRDGRFDREAGTLTYQIPYAARVLVRIGVKGSALFKTLANWQPRSAGTVTEYWNGKDADNLINLWKHNFSTLITYVTLPEASVISFGNSDLSYQAYSASQGIQLQTKPHREFTNLRKVSPIFASPDTRRRDFKAQLSFPGYGKKDSVPVFDDKMILKIGADESTLAHLENQQYEVLVFVDTVFVAEEERGYLPINFPVELHQIPPGDHVVSVNIATFDGNIGVSSAKFRIERNNKE